MASQMCQPQRPT